MLGALSQGRGRAWMGKEPKRGGHALAALGLLPPWVPEAARNYLVHTETGLPIRALARRARCHASTILRQIRRFENRRDDPLVDGALRQLAQCIPASAPQYWKEHPDMSPDAHFLHPKPVAPPLGPTGSPRGAPGLPPEALLSETRIEREGLRVLRRLCETGAVLAVAREMEKAVVVRDAPPGSGPQAAPTRTAVVDREIAQAMALKEWIACTDGSGRIARYHITGVGRAALKRLMAADENRAQGFSEAQAGFAGQHRDFGEREVAEDGLLRHMRANLAESPLGGLARRRDKDGKPFLARDLVAAGERLREDFELSQMGTRVAQNWDRFLSGPAEGMDWGRDDLPGGAVAARDRVMAALADLGPGLSDVALRCCCFLEGMETLERRMGWSARSGKIVLRIALQRLRQHYTETQGRFGPKIG